MLFEILFKLASALSEMELTKFMKIFYFGEAKIQEPVN